MAHFCWFLRLIFLLLMMAQAQPADARPARGSPASDLIAGNEFLKLFLERDELQQDLHSGEYLGSGTASTEAHSLKPIEDNFTEQSKSAQVDHHHPTNNRGGSRSLDYKSRNSNQEAENNDSKQLVKLVTTGSKIVFLEEYDDDDAVVDAVARDHEIKKEKVPARFTREKDEPKSHQTDEVKVVAVSVSSSSKREYHPRQTHTLPLTSTKLLGDKLLSNIQQSSSSEGIDHQKHNSHSHVKSMTSTVQPMRTTTSAPATSTLSSVSDFINRSHKSEFSIEETEPLTMSKQKTRFSLSSGGLAADVDAIDVIDSENSASTNIQNILAAPLVQTQAQAVASPSAYRSSSGSRNSTSHTQSHTHQTSTMLHGHIIQHDRAISDNDSGMSSSSTRPAGSDDKLLPFQTVIYHDTKEGQGPQSRSISYSSLSQNVEDLHRWQHTGILAEAQRNVSESLKPLPRPRTQHKSEQAKFYSVPAKMYGVPSKFYSEPAKVYSEPAKVYGQPEKFYSEPAKVYGQPSKFYSEPSQVYSQPAKVYGEPAKTYWPQPAGTTTTSSTTTTTVSPNLITTTTTTPRSVAGYVSSRRPAVISRIAFGEAQQTSTSKPTNYGHRKTTTATPSYQQHQTYHSRTHSHHHQHHQQHQSHPIHHQHGQTGTQPRRILFNLDKLPYDLLNAPEQSSKHLLDEDTAHPLQKPQPCFESPQATAVFSTSQQHRQHSSLSDQQRSNQNAKGLPNRELVKCVSKYPNLSVSGGSSPSKVLQYTTERSQIDELYRPTPEQNYEIEESVSVMTNGRAHGVQYQQQHHDFSVSGGGSAGLIPTTQSPSTTTTLLPTKSKTRSRIYFGVGLTGDAVTGHRQVPSNQHNTNANANVADNADYSGPMDHNSNNKSNQKTKNSKSNYNNYNYNNYDDDVYIDGDTDGVENAKDTTDGDADDDGDSNGHDDNGETNDDGDDDSKVAYVVEGRNYRKYRVEEKTDDGQFIVGEYGVFDHNDGNLRGVRYTADSTINPSVIQKALLTFLKLK